MMPIIFGSNIKYDPNIKVQKELFKSELFKINSINKAIVYIDSIYISKELQSFDTLEYVKITSEFTKQRFFHGLSRYTINDNWVAFISGKLLWSHFSGIVDPDDILKHTNGLCSQQTIVFMELLKRKGINVRSIGLGSKEGPGHFLSEVYYNYSWHLYDISLEPSWEKLNYEHNSMNYYLENKDSLYLIYESRLSKFIFNKIIKKVQYGEVNEFPAKHMLFFHHLTKILTYLLPVFFLLLISITIKKKQIQTWIIKKIPSQFKKRKSKLVDH